MAESKKKPAAGADKKANRRGAARLAAVQALYQMDIAGSGINDIFAEFESHWLGGEVEGEKYLPAEAAFFRDIVAGVVRDQARLDPMIDEALSKGWPLKRIDAILRAVLRARTPHGRAGPRRRVGICRRRQRVCRTRGDRYGQRGARPDRPALSCR
jgi:transcription antitermination protein NusB